MTTFNVKKNLIDPLTAKKIKVPSEKNIMTLKGADRYDEFNEIVEEQRNATVGGMWRIIVPMLVCLAGLGAATYEYVIMRIKNNQCYDKAELLINEAAAYNKINEKEND